MVKLFFVSIFKLNEDKTKVRRKTPIQELKDLDEKTVYVVSNTYIQVLMAQKNKFTPTPRKNPNRLMHKFHKEKLYHVNQMCVITMPQNTSIFHICHFLGMFTQNCRSPVAEKTVLAMWKHNLYQHTKVQKHW